MIKQIEFQIKRKKRGIHLITDLVLDQIGNLPENGLINIFIKHSSAALTINENADPSVRTDMNNFINKLIPDDTAYFEHTQEGLDDMPSHIKTSFFGNSLTIPITGNKLNLGIWQGIYLCEFRDNASNRNIVATIYS